MARAIRVCAGRNRVIYLIASFVKNRNELGSRVSLNFRNLNIELGRIIAEVAEATGRRFPPRGINTPGSPKFARDHCCDFIARELRVKLFYSGLISNFFL